MLQRNQEIKGFNSPAPQERYFVPDLSPLDRNALRKMRPRWVFVAESPHVNEIEPDQVDQRRPLCGAAGRQWWGLLTELLTGTANSNVDLDHLIKFCLDHRVAVLNAVQYPLDPKVARLFPKAEPVQNLGFSKAAGESSFKKLKKEPPVITALQSLRERLNHPALAEAPIHCLGNDAEWFVIQALGAEAAAERMGIKIPHPSAWWRQGGLFGRNARERLSRILSQ